MLILAITSILISPDPSLFSELFKRIILCYLNFKINITIIKIEYIYVKIILLHLIIKKSIILFNL